MVHQQSLAQPAHLQGILVLFGVVVMLSIPVAEETESRKHSEVKRSNQGK